MSVQLRSAIAMIMLSCSAGVLAGPPEKRVVQAIRAERPPAIDADLSDPAWQSAPEITGFTQYDPNDGKPSTQNTVVRIVYDNSAIYVGAFMHDTGKVTTLLGRRDSSLESDWFRVSFDSQNDDLNGASFWVNPSNVQYDTNLYNDIYDSENEVTFGNPDFNLRSVRGSAVVRWEFRPGSSLYVVWNENRSDVAPIGDFRVRRDFAAIPDALSKDVFLVKVSYWLPM